MKFAGWMIVCLFVGSVAAVPTLAQLNADMMEDSVAAKEYDYFFPLFGKEVVKKGFDLPYPVGLNVIGIGITQPLELRDFRLSFGEGNEPEPFPVVQFGDAQSTVVSGNLRLDLWVLPFLNVYGLYGQAQSNTTVKLAEPVEFESSVDQTGQYYGVGLTTAFGFFGHWASVDLNWTWADLELLDDPVRTRIIGIRLGHTWPLNNKGMKLAGWVGLMNAEIAVNTAGSIKISDALPPEIFDQLDEIYDTYQDSDWYKGLERWQQVSVDKVMDQLEAGADDRRDMPVNYDMQKALAYPTNLLLGAQWEINKSWVLRGEAGLIGRYSFLLNLNYRFPL